MANRVGKNYIYNVTYQVLIMILPFITTPYVSRVLGAEGVGIYNFTYSVVNVFTLIAVLGTNSYGIREIAYHQGDRAVCSKIFYEITAIRVVATVFLIPIYIATVAITGKYISSYIAAFTYLIAIPFDISWFFQGLEDFKKIVLRNTVVRMMGIVLIFIFVKTPTDVYKYTLIMGGTALIGHISLWLYLPKCVCKFNKQDFNPLRHLKSVLIFFIPALSIYIYTSLDKIVLGVFSTEAEVGYYSQSEKIVKLVLSVILSLSTVLMPRMAYLIKNGSMDEVKKNLNMAYQFVLILSMPMMIGLALVTDYFIPLFLGNGYDKCVILMYILLPLIFIMGLSNMTGTMVMIARGMQNIYNRIVVAASVINLFLNLIVVSKFQSIGVAVATIIAEGFVTVVEMMYTRDLIDFKAFFKNLVRYIVDSIVMGSAVLLLKIFIFSECSWASIVFLVFCGLVVYGVLLMIQKDPLIDVLKQFLGSLRFKKNRR